MATVTKLPQSKGCPQLDAHEVACRRLAPKTRCPSPLAPAALRRHPPEVGAVCGKAARTVLCGGRSATSVPTATALCALRPPLQETRSRCGGHGAAWVRMERPIHWPAPLPALPRVDQKSLLR